MEIAVTPVEGEHVETLDVLAEPTRVGTTVLCRGDAVPNRVAQLFSPGSWQLVGVHRTYTWEELVTRWGVPTVVYAPPFRPRTVVLLRSPVVGRDEVIGAAIHDGDDRWSVVGEAEAFTTAELQRDYRLEVTYEPAAQAEHVVARPPTELGGTPLEDEIR